MSKYSYYNTNPWRQNKGDCVCRAISAALDIKYVAVERLLELISDHHGCDKLCICCYHHLLEDIFGLVPEYAEGETIGEIAADHPGHKLLIRAEGHLTCSMYGVVVDTWDCTDEIADCFWTI